MRNIIQTPLDMFYHWEREKPAATFLRQPKALHWTEYSWAEVGDAARRVAAYLHAQNFPMGSCIAIWSGNSKDWVIADLAIMMAGHVSVPIFPAQDADTIRYVLAHCEARLMFIGAVDNPHRVDEIVTGDIQRVGLLGATCPVSVTLDEVLAHNAPITHSPRPDPDALATLMYTSGTTGNPKGVMHTHSTFGAVVPEIASVARQTPGDCTLFSYLPMAHIAERVLIEMQALYMGGTISFSEGLTTFAEELRSVQPTYFFSVPRLWTKFKGPGLMKGYYKEPEKSAAAFVDGWYRTGDTGRFDADGNLWVTGRISEVFKTTKGEYIKPSVLEDRLAGCTLLEQVCVFGQGLNQPVAVASLSQNGKSQEHIMMTQVLTAFLETMNADLSGHERIPKLFITQDEWTPESGLLTPTLKLKRKAIEAQYRDWVERAQSNPQSIHFESETVR
jgi:long-subunit acyl-CoA synthetase (AMP-forming)